MHVADTRQGYQTGDSGEAGAACAGIPVQAAGEETAGKAGPDAAEVWSRGDGERMFLAWT